MRSILSVFSIYAGVGLTLAACSANPDGPGPITSGFGGTGGSGGAFASFGGSGGGGVLPLDGGGGGSITDDCSENAKKIFVVSEQDGLYTFDPKVDGLSAYHKLGSLKCNSSSSPQTMGVDRSGTAWVFYSSGQLYRVSPVDGNVTCSPTTYKHPGASSGGSFTLGMGFTAKAADSKEQIFYMLSEDFGLASIDLADNYAVSQTGKLKNVSGELTGGPDARLFTYEADNAKLSEVQVNNGFALENITTLSELEGANAWAFARYAGVFYIFTANSGDSSCSTYDPTTKSFQIRDKDVGFTVVGAGQSTCVPPPPIK